MIKKKQFVQSLSIRPSKMVVYTSDVSKMKSAIEASPVAVVKKKNITNNSESDNVIKTTNNKHNFELSKSAQKNIQEKIQWLYYYARKKTVTSLNGKVLSDFKMSFVTLTLPSVQAHSSDYITGNYLNQLLIELKSKLGIENYVWRLEYQKNGNIHYHIATDVYINYYLLRTVWNRIINKDGYVDAYKKKMQSMSLNQYYNTYKGKANDDFKVLAERYAKGCRENWSNPSSVDVKNVSNSKAISFYISKYFGKNEQSKSGTLLNVNGSNSGNSRLWFCSRALSKLKMISDIREAFDVDYLSFMYGNSKVKRVVYDYCVVYYFSFMELSNHAKVALRKLFADYADDVGYIGH